MATTPPRRLEKSRTQRIMFGVTGGVAEYLGIDVVLVRVGFVLLAFASGIGLVAYIALAIFMPEAPELPASAGSPSEGIPTTPPPQSSPTPPAPPDSSRARYVVGGVLAAVGLFFLLQELHLFPWWWNWGVLVPVALIAIGVALVIGRVRR
ncbi:MAG: PspC domain-containing protein [Chloroflexi bacterium]|nr:PspC domain-containing protein [Chloroflexota bacterium]